MRQNNKVYRIQNGKIHEAVQGGIKDAAATVFYPAGLCGEPPIIL
jgi:hypothetical protein